MIKDKYRFPVNGKLRFIYKKNGKIFKEEDTNIVLNQSREFIRNLVFGDNIFIAKIAIGDMNKNLKDDCSNPPKPTVDDTELENEFFSKEYESKSKIIDGNDPAIKYTFKILKEEANDPSNSQNERKLWCEFGLKDSNDKLWTRIIKPVIKDNETEIIIEYILVF